MDARDCNVFVFVQSASRAGSPECSALCLGGRKPAQLFLFIHEFTHHISGLFRIPLYRYSRTSRNYCAVSTHQVGYVPRVRIHIEKVRVPLCKN